MMFSLFPGGVHRGTMTSSVLSPAPEGTRVLRGRLVGGCDGFSSFLSFFFFSCESLHFFPYPCCSTPVVFVGVIIENIMDREGGGRGGGGWSVSERAGNSERLHRIRPNVRA